MSFYSKSDALRMMQENGVRKQLGLGKIADSFMKCARTNDIAQDSVTAGLLNNFQNALATNPKYKKVMDAANVGAAGVTGAGNVDGNAVNVQGDFGPYVMEVWPLVTAWYPDFPLKDLISVQDMDKPLAYLFFSVLKTGTNKADTAQGDVVETPLGLRNIKGKYPTGEIYGENIPKSQFGGGTKALLAYAPLNVADIQGRNLSKHKVILHVGSPVAEHVYSKAAIDGNTVKLFYTVDNTKYVTIDIQTGELDTAHAQTAISADTDYAVVNYVWNLDYATDENIQKVKEQVEMRPMEALPRAIALEWTIFSEYVKKSQFGQDIRTDNTKRILNLLYQYQVRYILDDMYENRDWLSAQDPSVTSEPTINLTISGNVTLEVTVANVLKQLNAVSNGIELINGRMEANRIVCGQNFKTFLEALPDTLFKKAAAVSGFSGPREIGTIGRYKVYYDPFQAADKGFMTYRGDEWYDATYYLGEYMPIVPTDAVTLGVTVRESFVAMEAYRNDKPQCVCGLTFTL